MSIMSQIRACSVFIRYVSFSTVRGNSNSELIYFYRAYVFKIEVNKEVVKKYLGLMPLT